MKSLKSLKSLKWWIPCIAIAALCVADSVTTIAVIKTGKGYEENFFVAPVIMNPYFHIFKLALTISAVLFIHLVCKKTERPELEFAGYTSMLVGYILVVTNNTLIYLNHMGLPLTFEQFAALFFVIFFIALALAR